MKSGQTAIACKCAGLAAIAIATSVAGVFAVSSVPSYVAVAISDPARPAADKGRDGARKPADMIAFAGIRPGQIVLEILPGKGYFTRIFSKVVGPRGRVYTAVPDPESPDAEPAATEIATDVQYSNVAVVPLTADSIKQLPPVDVIWTSQNYHDFHLTRIHTDMAALDKAWFDILKPGGVVVIVDHAALPGSPAAATADKLHRIDPAIVRGEMQRAGFKFDGESSALRNPADSRAVPIFDPTIRGRTDQFVYRFRKPN